MLRGLLERVQWWLQSMFSPVHLTPLPAVTRLSSRVVRVLAANPGPMTLQGTNTYLVGTGPERILIDTGSGGSPEYLERLERVLDEVQCRIAGVIITHWHADHVGGVGDLRQRFGVGDVRKFPCADHPCAECDGVDLADQEEVTVEGATLQVLHTPGHTSDHISLLLAEETALFSGDCVLGETSAVFSNLHQYMRSLHSLQRVSPQRIYPGHGPVVTDPRAKLTEYIEHRLARERQIIDALSTSTSDGATVDQVVAKVYRDTAIILRRAAKVNALHHLEKLIEDKCVSHDSHTDKYSLIKDKCDAAKL